MPRPFNWIRGEGTVRNQRWGLNGMDVNGLSNYSGLASGAESNPMVPYGYGGMGDLAIEALDTIDPLGVGYQTYPITQGWDTGKVYGPVSVNGTPTVAQWMSQNSGALILGGVVLAVVLGLRR